MEEFHDFLVPAIPTNIRPSYLETIDDEPPQGEIDSEVIKNIDGDLEKLRNSLETERIKTYLRIRAEPIAKHIKLNKDSDKVFEIENPTTLLVRSDKKTRGESVTRFNFSGILGAERTQSSVFEECVQPIVDRFYDQENCLVFSYGATNSGKTFTMQGYGSNFGIVPRTLEYLFNRIEDSLYVAGDIKPNQFDAHCDLDQDARKSLEEMKQRVLRDAKFKAADIQSFRESCARSSFCSVSSDLARGKVHNINSGPTNIGSGNSFDDGPQHSVWVSFAEIYNERVYDLFETPQKGKKRKELKVYQDRKGQVYVHDLAEFCVKSAEEAFQLFLAGRENLQFATTLMNNTSSRSHSFFNIRMVTIGAKEGYVYPIKIHRLSFCDLAGIERVSQTGNVGLRLKESGNINQSLLVLLRCIRALRDKQQGKLQPSEILPYRDSKLARIFKSYLTTSTHIRMIVTINPDPRVYDTTMQVLLNSAVASKVQLVSRVEAPVFNNKFCRKVRDSMGLATVPTIKEESESEESSEYTSAEEDADEDSTNTETTPQTGNTVVNKPKVPPEMVNRIACLERENKKLRNEIRTIEDKIRDEVQVKYKKIYDQQEEFYKNLIQETLKRTEEVNKRRISLATQCLREYPEALLTTKGDKTPVVKKVECKDQSTGNISINEPGPVEDAGTKKSHVQGLAEKDTTIRLLREELFETDEELKVVKNEKLKLEKTVQDKSKNYDLLAFQLEEEKEARKGKERELEDAFQLCRQYHLNLEEANAKIATTQDAYNKEHLELLKKKEEEEYLHITLDDLQTKNTELEAELAKKNSKDENSEPDDIGLHSGSLGKRKHT